MKTVFLDRDGVINRNPADAGYVRSWSEFSFIPGAQRAIRELTQSGCRIIVVTNQAGVGRRILREATLREIHSQMTDTIMESGGTIHAIYYCPHSPEDSCECRKPKPGMLLRASQEHNIEEMSSAYLIGDSVTDIEAGRRAGTRTVLVLTGHGQESYQYYINTKPSGRRDGSEYGPEKIFTDLQAAARWLLNSDV